jgi:hypothetical protein
MVKGGDMSQVSKNCAEYPEELGARKRLCEHSELENEA